MILHLPKRCQNRGCPRIYESPREPHQIVPAINLGKGRLAGAQGNKIGGPEIESEDLVHLKVAVVLCVFCKNQARLQGLLVVELPVAGEVCPSGNRACLMKTQFI